MKAPSLKKRKAVKDQTAEAPSENVVEPTPKRQKKTKSKTGLPVTAKLLPVAQYGQESTENGGAENVALQNGDQGAQKFRNKEKILLLTARGIPHRYEATYTYFLSIQDHYKNWLLFRGCQICLFPAACMLRASLFHVDVCCIYRVEKYHRLYCRSGTKGSQISPSAGIGI